jgi:hypothetical protein
MDIATAQFLYETEGINAARTFLGYDPLPEDIAQKADADRQESGRLRDEALDRLNKRLAPFGVRL